MHLRRFPRRTFLALILTMGLVVAACETRAQPSWQASTGTHGAGAQASGWEGLEGLWNVRVEGLSIWAPSSSMAKTIGLVHWKMSWANGTLFVKEHSPSSNDPVFPSAPGVSGMPFRNLEISELQVSPGTLSFKVSGGMGSYEHFEFERVGERRILGRYHAYEPLGAPGHGPDHRGRLILERVVE